MKLVFADRGWEDHLYWQANDPVVLKRLNKIIEECRRTPFKGLGKPEPLKGDYKGWWSRRITLEDRLIYRIAGTGENQAMEIVQCRFRY